MNSPIRYWLCPNFCEKIENGERKNGRYPLVLMMSHRHMGIIALC